MKRLLSSAVLLVLATSPLTFAEEKKAADANQAGGPFAGEVAKKLLERFDANKDGRLSAEEQAKAEEAFLKEAAQGPVGEKFQEFLKKFDKNGDGQLNVQERAAAMSAVQKIRGGGSGAVRGANPGGTPAIPQGTPAAKPAKEKRPSRAEVIKQFDKDGDGKLNEDEKAAAKAAAKERRKGE